ncbi:MAG: hypothetical protein WC197_00455 [Candidatus Gastranaerophilaceae bacterium]|jgi:hypothetical protein
MLFLSLVVVLMPILFGFFIVDIIDRENSPLNNILYKLPLSVGIGFGFSSCLFFLWLMLFNTKNYYNFFETTIISILGIIWFLTKKNYINLKDPALPLRKDKNLFNKLLCLVFILAIIYFIGIVLKNPHGEADAIYIWNFKARYIFRALEGHWKGLFSSSAAWPDYPLLLSLFISKCWTFLSSETFFVPFWVSFFFTISVPFMLYGFFKAQNKVFIAAISTIMILLLSIFVMKGANQIADIPLSLYFLSTLSLLVSKDKIFSSKKSLLLAGITMGLACWTKNEGILFALFVFCTFGLKFLYEKNKNFIYFIGGISLVAPVLAIFKIAFPFKNPFISNISYNSFILNITDIGRYIFILKKFMFFAYANILRYWWGLIPVLVLVIFEKAFCIKKLKANFESISLLLLMLLGYFFVYLTSNIPLEWLIQTSLFRLYAQILPCFILLLFYFIDESKFSKYL